MSLIPTLLSLLERGGEDSRPLQHRLLRIPPNLISTTIVTYEEQMRGWLARAAQADSPQKMISAYARLQTHIQTFEGIPVLGFDAAAAEIYARFMRKRIRAGAMDLKIAAIVLANDATLLSRNLRDFSKIQGLRVEDWSAANGID